ncbi:hypothetical protein H0E87_000186 [Populus deltoides]|uniref:Alpha/beta hydrolase fold-3 domain-containing protein n=1 Tax=Populus deltoides TaxID=3696 RepID=A0A8T2ZLQ7_POPDE|nr:hypothetical protein H0E87_000186 [Populus deltoides]
MSQNSADLPWKVRLFTSLFSFTFKVMIRRSDGSLNRLLLNFLDYKTSPSPDKPIDDGFDVIKFIDKSYLEVLPNHANLKHSFVAGDSAGGNLAHHMALKACKSELSNIKLTGVIAIQPFFGGEERTGSEIKLSRDPFVPMDTTDWMWRSFLPEGSNRDHQASNVFGPNSVDISELKFPAVLVIIGGLDPLQDWQKRYYEGLKKSGKEVYLVEYVNAFHSFHLFPCVPEFSLFIKEVKDFMQKQMSR